MNSVLFSQTAEPSLRDPSSPIGFTTTSLLAQRRPCTRVTRPRPRRTPRTDAHTGNLELEAIRRRLFTGPDTFVNAENIIKSVLKRSRNEGNAALAIWGRIFSQAL